MITNLATVLGKAHHEGRCVPAINVYNLETVQAVFEASAKMQSPIIISFGESYLGHASLDVIVSMVRLLDQNRSLPVVLHLDHAKKFETIRKALDSGFTSVMYDGSHLPLEVNIENSTKVVQLAQQFDASVEGELGYLNPEDGSGTEIYADRYTRPEEAERYVNETGVDALAIAVGNAHGVYSTAPHLEFQRIAAIAKAVKIPLVLHGSSGIPKADLQRAIALGVVKINVNTEVALAGARSARLLLEEKPDARFELLMQRARTEMREVIADYIGFSYFAL